MGLNKKLFQREKGHKFLVTIASFNCRSLLFFHKSFNQIITFVAEKNYLLDFNDPNNSSSINKTDIKAK